MDWYEKINDSTYWKIGGKIYNNPKEAKKASDLLNKSWDNKTRTEKKNKINNIINSLTEIEIDVLLGMKNYLSRDDKND